MRTLRTWIDWFVLALCMAAAGGAVAYGICTLDTWPSMHAAGGRPASGALAAVGGLALVNCGFLVTAAACQAFQIVGPRRR
jgi:hypothetical protein